MIGGFPWFPLYVDDFLASPKVRRMDAHSVGVYLLLLLEQWQEGFIKSTPAELAKTFKTEPERVAEVLAACFKKTRRGWFNAKLEHIRAEQAAKSVKARGSAKARWDKAPDANALRTQSERNASQNQNQNQNQKRERPARAVREKKAGTDLPADWKPNEGHRDRARLEGVDCDREAEKFKAGAEANGRRYANWNSAFTTWLLRAKDFAPARASPTMADDRHAREAEEWGPKLRMIREQEATRVGELNRLSIQIPPQPESAA